MANRPRARHAGWSSFVADPHEERPRILYDQDNPSHRARVEYSRTTILIHLSDEAGTGWTVFAVDRASRRTAVARASRQLEAAEAAHAALYAAANPAAGACSET